MKDTEFKRFLKILILFLAGTTSAFASGEKSPEADKVTSVAVNSVNAVLPSGETDPAKISATSALKLLSASDYLKKAWEYSGQNDLTRLTNLVSECLQKFAPEAKMQQAALTGFPQRGHESEYAVLNDVGTVMFVRAEALMNNGRTEEAIALFQKIIEEYRFAQAWDPTVGAFWSVAEKSQNSIDVMMGQYEDKETAGVKPVLKTVPPVFNPGTDQIVDYRKYGEFVNVGTKDYKFAVSQPRELAQAVGYGIYPSNVTNIIKSEEYQKVKKEGRLDMTHWDSLRSSDLEAAYFKWINAPEPVGIRLYYLGLIFERAKMYYQALKAYHALIVHAPDTVAWTYWQTPWYPAQAAISKIKFIIRTHPELNLASQWMKIEVANGFDNDVKNDTVTTWPGIIKEKGAVDKFKEKINIAKKNVSLGKVSRVIGQGKVQLKQYENGHWQMFVKGKPFVIKGATYSPTRIGQSPQKGTLVSWMKEDSNNNGILDGPYEAWVDKNHNDIQDPDERTAGDFKLMKEMGLNTLREYYQPFKPEKEVLRKMFKEYGFMVLMGNFAGKYAFGSGATWFEGTDYKNPVHKLNMMQSIRDMVMDLKDEPYILMWVLGNENNYGVASNADKEPVAYYSFINDVARMIHEIDPDHPVAICNGDTLFLDLFAKYAPEVDVFGANVYRGDYGFGSFWEQVAGAFGKPAFITEYGSPAFAKNLGREEAEAEQAKYHQGNWLDIQANLAGGPDGEGNAIGGVAFEWLDEWWKNYQPFYHDKKSDAIGPFAGTYYYEEWFGLFGQGKGQHSPFQREPRQVYDIYKEMWNSKP